jgi:hypothetical protein
MPTLKKIIRWCLKPDDSEKKRIVVDEATFNWLIDRNKKLLEFERHG